VRLWLPDDRGQWQITLLTFLHFVPRSTPPLSCESDTLLSFSICAEVGTFLQVSLDR
jgi:hypothetical protein